MCWVSGRDTVKEWMQASGWMGPFCRFANSPKPHRKARGGCRYVGVPRLPSPWAICVPIVKTEIEKEGF